MTVRMLVGDVRQVLASIPDESVQCVVTSPPYWNLRDYGTGTWEGGDPACDHKAGMWNRDSQWSRPGRDQYDDDRPNRRRSQTCRHCGATKVDDQIGLEPTVGEYVQTMVAVFREVRRILRPDGTLWLNLGDCFNAYNGNRGTKSSFAGKRDDKEPDFPPGHGLAEPTLKQKDLVGVPWRVAFGLQDDGWYLRRDNIWHKTAPMPESVSDRTTTAHEYVFMLTKSPRYFYDAFAIREPDKGLDHPRNGTPKPEPSGGLRAPNNGIYTQEGRNGKGRNKRSVWTLGPEPFPEAHFAVMPTSVAEICIKAGTSEKGACAHCGTPWRRIVVKSGGTTGKAWHDHEGDLEVGQRTGEAKEGWEDYEVTEAGWELGCQCGTHETVPCVVLDPFGGAGTTSLVCERLWRDSIYVDLKPGFAEMAERRIRGECPMFVSIDRQETAVPDRAEALT